jgi:hypothetical protein
VGGGWRSGAWGVRLMGSRVEARKKLRTARKIASDQVWQTNNRNSFEWLEIVLAIRDRLAYVGDVAMMPRMQWSTINAEV